MIWQFFLIILLLGIVDGALWGATRWTLMHLGRRRTLTRRELNALVEVRR